MKVATDIDREGVWWVAEDGMQERSMVCALVQVNAMPLDGVPIY